MGRAALIDIFAAVESPTLATLRTFKIPDAQPVMNFLEAVVQYPESHRPKLFSFSRDLLHEQSVTEMLPVWAVQSCRSVVREGHLSSNSGNFRAAIMSLVDMLKQRGLQTLSSFLETLLVTLRDEYATHPLAQLAQASISVLQFLCQRCDEVEQLLDQQLPEEPVFISGSYNPPCNLEAYYHNKTGERVRTLPIYPDMLTKLELEERLKCKKKTPQSGTESRAFFQFCSPHGHCNGWCAFICFYSSRFILLFPETVPPEF